MYFNAEVMDYLSKHLQLKTPLNALLRATEEMFPNNEKKIRVFYDPDIEDSWLYVSVEFEKYPADLEMRMEKIGNAYLPLLEKCPSGWVTVMPECSGSITH